MPDGWVNGQGHRTPSRAALARAALTARAKAYLRRGAGVQRRRALERQPHADIEPAAQDVIEVRVRAALRRSHVIREGQLRVLVEQVVDAESDLPAAVRRVAPGKVE